MKHLQYYALRWLVCASMLIDGLFGFLTFSFFVPDLQRHTIALLTDWTMDNPEFFWK